MAGLSFTARTLERVAEDKIRAAMREGFFDHLSLAGQPIPGIDTPYDPDWWVKAWLRREAGSRGEKGGLPKAQTPKVSRLRKLRALERARSLNRAGRSQRRGGKRSG